METLLIAEQAEQRATSLIDGLLDDLERETDHDRKRIIRKRIADAIWQDGAVRALIAGGVYQGDTNPPA